MSILLDTGTLYAFLDRNDYWHSWAISQFSEFSPPFTSCEAVLTETLFLMHKTNIDTDVLFELLTRKLLHIQPITHTANGQKAVRNIMNKYNDLPASFADSCLVLLAEKTHRSRVITLDKHFSIYRTTKGEVISTISPHSQY
ncbi:MAG: PIN domain-containing protein [Balneolales bacterium]